MTRVQALDAQDWRCITSLSPYAEYWLAVPTPLLPHVFPLPSELHTQSIQQYSTDSSRVNSRNSQLKPRHRSLLTLEAPHDRKTSSQGLVSKPNLQWGGLSVVDENF